MRIESLAVNNFKNIRQAELKFCRKVNCLIGDNGMGKSNLLDAIYYLSYCRSYTGINDALVITSGEDVMFLSGKYLRKGVDEDISVGLRRGDRKIFRRGKKEYDRLGDHIGLLPAVLVSPADTAIIDGYSETRRRYMDMTFAQGDNDYMNSLMRYRHALDQRNKMLREGCTDASLFEAVECQMDFHGSSIMAKRQAKAVKLQELFLDFYSAIAGDSEHVLIDYKPSVTENLMLGDALLRNRERDSFLKFTSAGPHRDDLVLSLQGMPARHIASQGQAKSLTIALRLAQYCFIAQNAGLKPILLLDDIFDKLDSNRVKSIISLVSRPQFGQIFITDTNAANINGMLASISLDDNGFQSIVYTVENGKFNLL